MKLAKIYKFAGVLIDTIVETFLIFSTDKKMVEVINSIVGFLYVRKHYTNELFVIIICVPYTFNWNLFSADFNHQQKKSR